MTDGTGDDRTEEVEALLVGWVFDPPMSLSRRELDLVGLYRLAQVFNQTWTFQSARRPAWNDGHRVFLDRLCGPEVDSDTADRVCLWFERMMSGGYARLTPEHLQWATVLAHAGFTICRLPLNDDKERWVIAGYDPGNAVGGE